MIGRMTLETHPVTGQIFFIQYQYASDEARAD
jgi:hypothetical protein